MNRYKLYQVRYMKGILMYDYVDAEFADNIIEAEHLFETKQKMVVNNEYVITIHKQS